jgi:hypothetical protein
MSAAYPNDRIPSDGPGTESPLDRLAERVLHSFDQHPRIAHEKFLLEAARREFDFREQRETGNGDGPACREGQGTGRWSTARPPRSAEDSRIPFWLIQRLAALHYERHGLWPRLRRSLLGNRLVRWLGFPPRRTGDEGSR